VGYDCQRILLRESCHLAPSSVLHNFKYNILPEIHLDLEIQKVRMVFGKLVLINLAGIDTVSMFPFLPLSEQLQCFACGRFQHRSYSFSHLDLLTYCYFIVCF
jgi:hypothetical protein